MTRSISRRALLRGSGVVIALPWLASLAPKSVHAEPIEVRRRFLPIYLPNGAHDFWLPAGTGSGDAWQLSSILEPFGAALKSKLNIVTNLENGSVFNSDGASHVEPSHGRLSGAWLTCVDATAVRGQLQRDEANGTSVDQILAQHSSFKGRTAFDSLQLGLSTPLSNCDGEPCSSSRSVSWANPTQPLYKLVDPLAVFNQLVGATHPSDSTGAAALEAQKRLTRKKSVLDAVLHNAQSTRAKLGASDQQRMDEFLESVRAVERRVVGVSTSMNSAACTTPPPYGLPSVAQSAQGARQTSATYDKGLHADAMNDLITMAFECDLTRVISYMLEDERSEFTYDNVQQRAFTAHGSSLKGGTCPEYHSAQHSGGDDFATITWWNVGKVADLCRKLSAIEEAPGVSVLDNCVVLLGGCMHGGNHEANQLPLVLVGGRNLGLKNDQHIVLDNRPLRDLYATLLNDVFAVGAGDFGQNLTGAPAARVTELLLQAG